MKLTKPIFNNKHIYFDKLNKKEEYDYKRIESPFLQGGDFKGLFHATKEDWEYMKSYSHEFLTLISNTYWECYNQIYEDDIRN